MMNIQNDQVLSNQTETITKSVMSVDEKLKLALMDKPVFKTPQAEGILNENQVTKCDTQEGRQEIANITGESVVSRSDSLLGNKTNSLKGKKVFKIKKYVKYNKFLSEICSDEELSEKDKKELKDPKNRKISPFSKVNFSKLRVEEKDERLKNLALLVKRLRRKVRNLEHKVRFNATKLLNKHLWNKLGINSKNKYLLPEFQFDFDKVCKALKKVRNFDHFEFSDEKHVIENIINLIAEDKLKFDSITFKKICTLIRKGLNREKIKYLDKKGTKNIVSFPETDVFVSNKEYQSLVKFKDNEEVTRAILGVEANTEENIIAEEVIDKEEPKPNSILANLLLNSTNNSLFAKTDTHDTANQNYFNQTMNNFNNMPNLNGLGGMNNPVNFNNLLNNMTSQNNAPNANNINSHNLWMLNNNAQMQNYLMNSLGLLGANVNVNGQSFNNMTNLGTPQNLMNMNQINRGFPADHNRNMFLK